jgi:catechol 2,3-dioxygenase-like lactoylglutathione lyase family enzyme
MKLEHIALTIADSKELSNFYCDVLGFKTIKKFELNQDLASELFNIPEIASVCVMQRDDLVLEIFIYSEINEYKYNHVCLLMKNREEAYARAVAGEYKCIRIKRRVGDIIFIKDKSDNIFEIKEG